MAVTIYLVELERGKAIPRALKKLLPIRESEVTGREALALFEAVRFKAIPALEQRSDAPPNFHLVECATSRPFRIEVNSRALEDACTELAQKLEEQYPHASVAVV